jgi:hypothetical protein
MLVTTILVAPLGHGPLTQRTIDALAGEPGAEPVIDHLRRTSDGRRYFAVGFTDGKTRAVFPHRDDPLRFEYQIVGDSEGLRRLDPSDA